MLELHKQSPRSLLDKERMGRVPGGPPWIIKIEPAADRAIDKLVYELYGLAEEEIRIVEGEGIEMRGTTYVLSLVAGMVTEEEIEIVKS